MLFLQQNMVKKKRVVKNRAISIDKDYIEMIEQQAEREIRNFSTMVETMAKFYFESKNLLDKDGKLK